MLDSYRGSVQFGQSHLSRLAPLKAAQSQCISSRIISSWRLTILYAGENLILIGANEKRWKLLVPFRAPQNLKVESSLTFRPWHAAANRGTYCPMQLGSTAPLLHSCISTNWPLDVIWESLWFLHSSPVIRLCVGFIRSARTQDVLRSSFHYCKQCSCFDTKEIIRIWKTWNN